MTNRLLCAVLLLCGLASAQFRRFLTRPGQRSVTLEVRKNSHPHLLDHDYIWISPYTSDFHRYAGHYGPHIFKNDGELVWFGNESVENRGMDAHLCDFAGHGATICYNDANPVHQGGHSEGVVRFFDNTYTEVGRDHGSRNGLGGPDIHELNTPRSTAGTSFIQDVFHVVHTDLSAFRGPFPGYILSGCFQEVSLVNNTVLFQWCSHDHVPLDNTYVYIDGAGNDTDHIAGNGSYQAPWDYFHINAIAKDAHGDYIVSARQFHTLFKIAGRDRENPGSIMWRLGGKRNDFKMEPTGFNFSWQHDARWQENFFGPGTTGVSLFNNAYENILSTKTANASSGQIVQIDEARMTATLRHEFIQPGGKLTPSQGSLQVLDSGNVFMGWGALPYVSEHLETGEPIYYAEFAPNSHKPLQSYRAYKLPWVGRPQTKPDILPFSRYCNSSTKYVYASWNGATEVRHWKVYTANSTRGPWLQQQPAFKKTSYETMMPIFPGEDMHAYARVQALDRRGRLLGTSAARRFFVPSDSIASVCSNTNCTVDIDYSEANSMAQTCLS